MKNSGRIVGFTLCSIALLLGGCQSETVPELPILGESVYDDATGTMTDYRLPDFTLRDQAGRVVSAATVAGTVQVVDFFFTSCPTICPTMTRNLLTVRRAFHGSEALVILSHTIDPRRDTPARLRAYARANGIRPDGWYLLTGERTDIFELARAYKVPAFGAERPGDELFHDGTFVLLDGQRRIRGYYNGLDAADTERLIRDARSLLP